MDVQESKIEPSNQESKQLNIKQEMEEEPLNQVSTITFSVEKDCNQILMSDLKSILDIAHSQSKIEIILSNLQSALIEQLQSEQNKFSKINLNFKTIQQKLSSSSPLAQEQKHEIDLIENQLNQQRIYKFREQVENQVSQRLKLILFNWKIIPRYLVDSQKPDQNIQVNLALSQYQINGKDEKHATDLFLKMQSDLNASIILLKECYSNEEARAISYILQQGEIYINLQNTLNTKMVIIDSTTELNLDDLLNDNSIKDQVYDIKQGQPTVFAIIQVNDIQQNSIKQLQERFTEFIDDSKNIKKLEDKQTFQLLCLPNLLDIKKQIESLNIYGCEIEISEPSMDYQTNKYQVEVEYTLWYPGVMQITHGQQMLNQIKNQLFDLFHPIISLTLRDKDQIEVWYDYLNKEYEINCDGITIKTVRNTEINEIEIRLSGGIDKCMVMKEQIQQELNQIEFKAIELEYQTNISNFNRREQVYSNQFKKQLELISSSYANLRIKIVIFDTDSNKIKFKVQYRSNLTYDQIKQILQNELILKIQFYTVIIDFPSFLQFLKIDTNAFEEVYSTIVGEMDDKFIFLSTQQFLEPVKVLISQFSQATQEKSKTVLLKIDSNLLFQKLQQMIQTEEIQIQEDVKCNFILTSIQLVGPEESVLRCQSMIIDVIQQLKLSLIKRPLDLSSKEVDFIIKNIKLDQYLRQYECEIKVNSDKMSSRNQIASTLTYQERELNVAYADISKFECQAIVNICNHIMSFEYADVLSGVSKRIFDIGGPNYTQFCQKYIQKHKIFESGKAITYKMPDLNDGVVNYIINISIPTYQNGEQTNQNYLNIEQSIQAVFVEANNFNITTFALTILGGRACGHSFQQIVQTTLQYIINNLYSEQNQTVQRVDVIEVEEFKLTQISEILQKIVQPSELNRQIKYQWQWIEGSIYKDYDEEVNKQIDLEFEQFKNQKQKRETRELKLIFPCTKQPGTHLVNLQQMQITDISLGTKIKLSLQMIQGKQRFLFGGLQIDDDINEYLILQKLVNHLEFQIFYKKHKIIFNSNGVIKQINESTGFSRNVRAIPNQKNQQSQNILIGKNIKLEQKPYNKDLNRQSTYQIFAESFDLRVIDDVQSLIKTQIYEKTMDYQISLPQVKEDDFKNLKIFIQQNSFKAVSDFVNGQTLTVRIFNGQKQIIQDEIDRIIVNTKKYPINWIHQNNNLIKVDLHCNSEEFKQIQLEFHKTENGKISKIFRLQNQRQWENYQLELQKLKIRSQKTNIPLTQLEQERYLWYGLKEQHPNKIYKNMKEAFDTTQKEKCLWGKGIHFSEQAIDQRVDSYKLTEQDDPFHAGKLVIICCKVTTGKIYSSYPDTNIRRPPERYDCVRGFTSGQNFFIIYANDIKRVYPAYEIMYE